MSNWYVHRDRFKDAVSVTTSGDDPMIDMAIETASRLIDDWLGFHVFPGVETRYYTPRDTERLSFDRPLLDVTALRTDSSGDSSFGTTWATNQYHLTPYNATAENPPQPYWGLEVRTSSTNRLPRGTPRSVELVGTWGQHNQRDNSSASPATGLNATQATFEVGSATAVHVGQTIRLDNEQMFVTAVATTSGGLLTVERAVNGTTGATHTSGAALTVYRYGLQVERGCLYQAQMDFRQGKADPAFGGSAFGESGRMPSAQVDLHPRVRAMLRAYYVPRVG